MTKLKPRSICMQLRRPSTGFGSSQGLARGSTHPLLKAKKRPQTTLDSHSRPIADNGCTGGGPRASATSMAAGAGLVHPQQALDLGLVYDVAERDYVDSREKLARGIRATGRARIFTRVGVIFSKCQKIGR